MIFKILKFVILAFFCTTLAQAERNGDHPSFQPPFKDVHSIGNVFDSP